VRSYCDICKYGNNKGGSGREGGMYFIRHDISMPSHEIIGTVILSYRVIATV
jgi:hypothetical protein